MDIGGHADFFAHVDQVDTTDHGGGASITTRVQYEYDGYGNVTAEYHHGNIAVSGDERSVHRGFKPNVSNPAQVWIVNKPAWENVYEGITGNVGGSAMKTQTLYYYDQATYYLTPPTKGSLTKVERGREYFGFVDTQYEYDATWGNLTAEIDPNNNRTDIEYDGTYHLYPVETCNALGDCTETRYFGVDGIAVDYGLPGQVKKVIDPNGAETKYGYDDLGRLTDVIRPLDSRSLPTVRYVYADGPAPFRVETWQRETSGCSTCELGTFKYYDGLGRTIQTRSEGTGSQWAVGSTEYDALGRAVRGYVPQFGSGSSYTTPGGSYTATQYDALGRAVRVVNPDGTASSTMYAGLYTSQVDANGHYKFAVSDAFGRLARVDETVTTLEEPFSSLNSSTWNFSGHQSIDGGTLKNTGTGSNYNANFYRTSYSLSAEEGIKVEFKVSQGNTAAHFSLETSDGGVYRRWGVIANSNKIYAQFNNGGGWQYPADLINPVQVGKWYVLTLKVGADGTFYTELWQKDDPSVRGTYAGQMASGKNWRFHHWAYRGTAWLDNYHELDYQSTDYAYDILDNLISVTDAAGNVTTMTYDPLGRKEEMIDPDMGHWYYQYDDVGNLKRQRDARGQRVCFYYDPLNRLTGKHYRSDDSCPSSPTLNVSYTYDQGTNGIGQRTRMDDGSGYTTWTYDGRGRMTKETKVINGTGGGTFVTRWGYDAMDRVTWTRYPGGSGGQQGEYVYNTYNTQGLVNSVYGTSTYVSSTSYDAAGRVDLRVLGNSRRTDYVYYPWTTANGLGRVKYIKTGTTSSPTALQYMRYVYDAVGNVTQIKDYKAGGTQTQSFTYDALDRLKTAAASGGSGGTYSQKSYSYNAIGNITNFEGTAYYYQASAHTHAVTHLGGTSSTYRKYWYDANGNMTTRKVGSNTYNLIYDAENRLTNVSGAASATFVYDGDGNRVKATFGSATTVYVGNYFEWTGSTSTMKKYYYAGGARVAMRQGGNAPYYILTDHLGSTAITVSNGGSEYGELRYYPYGGTRYTSGTTPTSRRFTGQISDDTIGLYFYNARYYDAALGRFVQADTIVPSPGNPQSLNRYSYVLNSP